jgi:hypothetical protein
MTLTAGPEFVNDAHQSARMKRRPKRWIKH